MNLLELQKEARAVAKSKGCWDEPRTFGDLIALVPSLRLRTETRGCAQMVFRLERN